MAVAVAFKVQPELFERPALRVVSRPILSAFLIFFADLASLFLVSGSSVLLRQHFQGHYAATTYWRLWPMLVLFLLAYRAFGAYPGIGISPVAEIRKTTGATTLSFLILAALAFMAKEAPQYSRGVFVLAWTGMLLAVPVMRSLVRKCAANCAWWGYPVVVCDGDTGDEIVRKLQSHPEFGLRPVAILMSEDDSGARESRRLPRFPANQAAHLARLGVRHSIIAANDLSRSQLLPNIEKQGKTFPHLLVIPDMDGIATLGVETRDICSLLVLEVRKNLLLRGPQIAKRTMDILVGSIIGICALPVIGVLVLLIKLESGGSPFFSHGRMGRGGRNFKVWKLRTMKPDAEHLLLEYLRRHPESAFEWQVSHKLKQDPRLTRIGRLLRRTSLDELPQLWNILVGEMSLVGPRPIVDSEIEKYGEFYRLYTQVTPGLTGLWQVSGRNDTTYEERVALDAYYVRNWSPWLDIYLLARTFQVVITSEGAY